MNPFPFELDQFQKEALKIVQQNKSLIVSAPTGCGKTVIAEFVIQICLQRKQGLVYCSPIKALSNQKYRDFRSTYGEENVGILTGDVSINPDAPILIMTTEIFRNTILDTPSRLNNKFWAIFDEIHYLDDIERGTVWEECIIMMPEHIKILGLSATIPNVYELAEWIKTTRQCEVEVIVEKKRPVDLEIRFQAHNKIYYNFTKLKEECYPYLVQKHNPTSVREFFSKHQNKLITLIKHLKENHLLPCIYFSFSRRRCEYLSYEIKNIDFLTTSEKEQILTLYEILTKQFGVEDTHEANEMKKLIRNGIAFHHAGMLPTMKEIIEQLFTSRLIKIIFTTETFALGINMPAKTVIFDDLKKYYGTHFGELRTRDFYQMAGRAGRRGIDEKGYVYCRINPNHIDFYSIKRIVFGKPERVISQFNLSYATILHLYKELKEKLIDIYPKSFAHYQSGKSQRKRDIQLIRKKIQLLKQLNYIHKQTLTEKGDFASHIYGYELTISELYFEGILQRLSITNLIAILCSVVFEPRKGQTKPKLPHNLKRIIKDSNKIIRRVIRMEKKAGIFPQTKKIFPHLSLSIIQWYEEKSFAEIQNYTDTDPGEIIRYFRMTIQVMRDILSISSIPNSLREKLHIAIQRINRDEVNAEHQLRIQPAKIDSVITPDL